MNLLTFFKIKKLVKNFGQNKKTPITSPMNGNECLFSIISRAQMYPLVVLLVLITTNQKNNLCINNILIFRLSQ